MSSSEAGNGPNNDENPVILRSQLPLSHRIADTLRHYWDLGFISFGGPGVHVVLLRRRFVTQIKWLDASTFQDLFTLGNALPGPGSTQLAFSIAATRNGTVAGLFAFFLWSLPGAAIMAGVGAGSRSIPLALPEIVLALLTGLNSAAVGLIAVAAYQLSSNAVTDFVTRLIVLGSASVAILYHAPWVYPVLVVAGGIITVVYDYRLAILDYMKRVTNFDRRRKSTSTSPLPTSANDDSAVTEELEMQRRGPQTEVVNDTKMEEATVIPQSSSSQTQTSTGPRRRPNAIVHTAPTPTEVSERESTEIWSLSPVLAASLGVALVVGIVVIVVVRAKIPSPPRALDFFTNMLIAGIIIFGGGPVVIPLLRGYTVDNGWVSSRDFLLGFAILTAMPGPNFNFAVFLGILSVPDNPALGAFLGYVGIFTPGIVLKLALLPLYKSWRSHGIAKSVLRGLNAAASGLVYTAVYQLFLVGYLYRNPGESESMSGSLLSDPWWTVLVAAAFVTSFFPRVQPPFAIVGGAVGGLLWYAVTKR